MHKLPKYIFVLSIIRYIDNAELVAVLKDYFSGVPYMDITDYESNKKTVQYIVYSSRIIKKVAFNIYSMRNVFKILDYNYYELNEDSTMYRGIPTYTAFNMPKIVSVDSIRTQLQLWNTI